MRVRRNAQAHYAGRLLRPTKPRAGRRSAAVFPHNREKPQNFAPASWCVAVSSVDSISCVMRRERANRCGEGDRPRKSLSLLGKRIPLRRRAARASRGRLDAEGTVPHSARMGAGMFCPGGHAFLARWVGRATYAPRWRVGPWSEVVKTIFLCDIRAVSSATPLKATRICSLVWTSLNSIAAPTLAIPQSGLKVLSVPPMEGLCLKSGKQALR
jgi:hypothetical protein